MENEILANIIIKIFTDVSVWTTDERSDKHLDENNAGKIWVKNISFKYLDKINEITSWKQKSINLIFIFTKRKVKQRNKASWGKE